MHVVAVCAGRVQEFLALAELVLQIRVLPKQLSRFVQLVVLVVLIMVIMVVVLVVAALSVVSIRVMVVVVMRLAAALVAVA